MVYFIKSNSAEIFRTCAVQHHWCARTTIISEHALVTIYVFKSKTESWDKTRQQRLRLSVRPLRFRFGVAGLTVRKPRGGGGVGGARTSACGTEPRAASPHLRGSGGARAGRNRCGVSGTVSEPEPANTHGVDAPLLTSSASASQGRVQRRGGARCPAPEKLSIKKQKIREM